MVPRLSHEPALQERTPPHSGATAVGAARDNAQPQLKNASTCFSCFHVEEVKRSCASLPLVVQYSVSNNILTSATMGMDRWRQRWSRKNHDAGSTDRPKPHRSINHTSPSPSTITPTPSCRSKPEASSITHTVSSQTRDQPISKRHDGTTTAD